MQTEWLKFKKYPHIGKPLISSKDSVWVENYVTKPENIIKHKFTPLLHRVITQRKFRPDEGAIKNIVEKEFVLLKSLKNVTYIILHIWIPLYLVTIIVF